MGNTTTEDIYNFIERYFEEHGIPPSHRDIAQGCYLANSAVIRHLDKLEAQGRVQRIPGKARGIRLVKK